jgi:hypothetical protein
MKLHGGINMTRVAGDGLVGLPGLLMTIAFIFIFAGIFVPRESGNWLLPVFLIVETGAAILYILNERRSHAISERLKKEMHRINEQSDR